MWLAVGGGCQWELSGAVNWNIYACPLQVALASHSMVPDFPEREREHPKNQHVKGRKQNWSCVISTVLYLSKWSRALLDSRAWEDAKVTL